MSQSRSGMPSLKDGQALDRLVDRAERWAAKYKRANDEDAFHTDFDAKFRPEAEQLASQCTLPARSFGLKEWLMAVPLWLILAGAVFIVSVLVMQPQGAWIWVFAAVAAAIFLGGFGAVYIDTTSERRAQQRYRDKVEWLLGSSRRFAKDALPKSSNSSKG